LTFALRCALWIVRRHHRGGVIGALTCIVLFASAPWTLMSQVEPAAYKDNPSLWAGAEFANYYAGFPHGSDLRLSGLGAFVNFDWTHRIGIEGHARFFNMNSWNGETFLKSDHWRPFADFEIGVVRIHYPFQIGTGDQFALAPGGGLEYRLNRRVSVRTVYEYQFLSNSPDFTNEPHFGIHPNGITCGFSIRPF